MFIKSEKQLLTFVKYSPIIVISVIAILVNILIYTQRKSNFENDLQIYKKNFIETNKDRVKTQVEKVYNKILTEQAKHKDDLKRNLNNKLNEAYSIIEGIHKSHLEEPREFVLEIIKEALRNIRFNEGRGYYYIFSMDGTNILQPIKPQFENTNLYYKKDFENKYFIQEIINNLKKKDRYSLKGTFYKPNDTTKTYKKVLMQRVYRPLNIFIGTGEYIDDYLNDLKKYILEKHVQNISFGKNGYVFVFDYDGLQLAHIKKSYINKNRIDLTDKNGFKITQEIIKTAKQGSGFIQYEGTILPETGKPASKTTYIKGIDDWRWAIGSGFYEIDMQRYLKEKTKEIEKLNNEALKETLIMTIILIALLFMLALNITKILEKFFKDYRNRIEEEINENRRKDLVLYQQSKMASMGEMLGNIAHQWRQPLSTISTIASGQRLQKDMNMLDDKEFDKGMDTIVSTTKYLSQTIDDFRNFFNPNKVENEHTTKIIFEKAIQIISSRLNYQSIKIIENIDEVEIITYENELVQSIINILNNAIDAFESKEQEDKVIFFDIKYKKECSLEGCQTIDCSSFKNGFIIITLKDNAGGIPNNVINKIFDVYFTTKHKSQGTGIGLYMTYEIITKHLDGSVFVENKTFKYNNIEYNGAQFTIVLPIK